MSSEKCYIDSSVETFVEMSPYTCYNCSPTYCQSQFQLTSPALDKLTDWNFVLSCWNSRQQNFCSCNHCWNNCSSNHCLNSLLLEILPTGHSRLIMTFSSSQTPLVSAFWNYFPHSLFLLYPWAGLKNIHSYKKECVYNILSGSTWDISQILLKKHEESNFYWGEVSERQKNNH